MLVAYISLTGNTRRFVEKLDMKSLEINQMQPEVEVNEDYVFILPTYSDTLTDIAEQFITYKNNKKYLKGIIGGGEKNFGTKCVFSAKDLSKRLNVPIIFDFEKSGNNVDVEKFKKEVYRIEITKTKQTNKENNIL